MCASGAKYGMMTVHFYWGGAIPAMVFVGLFMMPFYYGSRARSVPEYLKLRFDEKTRAFNAFTFAGMTVFSSGISMYALGLLLQVVLGWSFRASVLLSAAIVLAYTFLGGLTSAIYNEVLQFFLVVLGFAPLALLALARSGGWGAIQARVPEVMTHIGFLPQYGVYHRKLTLAREGPLARQHLVECRAKSEQVATGVRLLPLNLFRAHVWHCAQHRARHRDRVRRAAHGRAHRGFRGGTFAKPKSSSFVPDFVSMMLPGFRSRCTIPSACAAASAPAISMANSSTSDNESTPRFNRCASVSPSRNSITR
jgi:hypothetical protein